MPRQRRASKFKAFDDQITFAIKGIHDFERNFLEQAAAEFFAEAREQNMRILGYAPRETLTTDGVRGKSVRDMEEYAVTDFDIGSDIIPWTAQLLKMMSPRSGANDKDPTTTYAESWRIIAGGRQINPLAPQWDGISTLFFVNTVPYARKIAAGLSAGRPNGWLESSVLPQVRKRYSNLFLVGFDYETVPGLENLIMDMGNYGHELGPATRRIRRWPAIWAETK